MDSHFTLEQVGSNQIGFDVNIDDSNAAEWTATTTGAISEDGRTIHGRRPFST